MILEFLYKIKIKLRDWSVRHIHGKKAKLWLALLSFSEASFFLIPPDVLLVAILAVNAERWLFYSSFTTLFSVLGGMFGYFIGISFFDLIGRPIVDFYSLQPQMLLISEKFNHSAFLAIFLSAFTPIPYKLFTISAGFFKIDFLTFIVASVFGRGMRFFAVGFLMKKYGKHFTKYLFKYFDIISLLVVLLLVALFFFI